MKKQKVYWGLVIVVVIIVVLGIFFYKRANAPTEPINQNMAGTEIPANMSISDEIGG